MKRISKKWKEIKLKTISYKINKRIDSTRLMATYFYILFITLLKELIELNVNMNMVINIGNIWVNERLWVLS